MKEVPMVQRALGYQLRFPKYPPLYVCDNKIYGIWIIGNYYKNDADYYGAYPHSYLKRVLSLFPDAERILHLFSGSLPEGDYVRFDLSMNADITGDAHNLSRYFAPSDFDLILADPPYSNEDAEHYGKPMVNRTKVVSGCSTILEKGSFLVWLDQVFPMFRKDEFDLVGVIGLIRSTNHRVRCAFVFRRK